MLILRRYRSVLIPLLLQTSSSSLTTSALPLLAFTDPIACRIRGSDKPLRLKRIDFVQKATLPTNKAPPRYRACFSNFGSLSIDAGDMHTFLLSWLPWSVRFLDGITLFALRRYIQVIHFAFRRFEYNTSCSSISLDLSACFNVWHVIYGSFARARRQKYFSGQPANTIAHAPDGRSAPSTHE